MNSEASQSRNGSLSLRRQPVQARSRERVETILHAAEHLIAVHGLGALTTNRVAAEAGMSVGALYQFFPNKEALVSALAQRLVTAFEARLRVPPGADPATWSLPAEVEAGVSALSAFIAANPAYPHLYLAARAGGAEAARMLDGGIAHFEAIFARRAPGIAAGARRLHARVAVETAQALLVLAAGAEPDTRGAITDEVMAVLERYLAPFYGTPADRP